MLNNSRTLYFNRKMKGCLLYRIGYRFVVKAFLKTIYYGDFMKYDNTTNYYFLPFLITNNYMYTIN